MRYKTKEGTPLCRYCLKPLAQGRRNTGRREKVVFANGQIWRDIYEPSGTYGRLGRDLFCTMNCAEQWAYRQLTGFSVPRGKSHDRGE